MSTLLLTGQVIWEKIPEMAKGVILAFIVVAILYWIAPDDPSLVVTP